MEQKSFITQYNLEHKVKRWEGQNDVTSTNSCVSLKGELSKPKFRGEHERMKPKSIWIIWPSPSNKMLPLCLQHKQYSGHLICNRQFCLERAQIVAMEKMRS